MPNPNPQPQPSQAQPSQAQPSQAQNNPIITPSTLGSKLNQQPHHNFKILNNIPHKLIFLNFCCDFLGQIRLYNQDKYLKAVLNPITLFNIIHNCALNIGCEYKLTHSGNNFLINAHLLMQHNFFWLMLSLSNPLISNNKFTPTPNVNLKIDAFFIKELLNNVWINTGCGLNTQHMDIFAQCFFKPQLHMVDLLNLKLAHAKFFDLNKKNFDLNNFTLTLSGNKRIFKYFVVICSLGTTLNNKFISKLVGGVDIFITL